MSKVQATLWRIRQHPRTALVSVAGALLTTVILALGIGAVWITPLHVLDALASGLGVPGTGERVSDMHQSILYSVRVPRVFLGVLAGAVLAVTGVLMQAFFRNPLADPALIGVAAGGALGAVSMIVLGVSFYAGLSTSLSIIALPAAAFLGSLLASGIVFALARQEGRVDVATMLLCGIAVNAMAGAGIGLLSFAADDAQLRDLTFWSLGSLGAASWWQVQAVLPAVLVLVLVAGFLMPALNALLLGDAEALHLGYRVEWLKVGILLLTCLGAGAVVATCGVIGFIGLIAPHVARLLVGPDHRHVLPLAAMLGATLLTLADIVARTIVSPAELPIGVLTALIGGPIFLWLLRRKHGGDSHA
jgi:iron complex transport system permease protein